MRTPEERRAARLRYVAKARATNGGMCNSCNERPKTGSGYLCSKCSRERYRDNAKANAATARRRAVLRAVLIEKFGGRCATCGMTHPDALVIDHIANDGNADRPGGKAPNDWLRWLVKTPIEELGHLQLLCWNCNMIKAAAHRRSQGAIE